MASANEERFTRKKMETAFPRNAIEYVLEEGGITIEDVDWFASGAWKGIDQNTTLPEIIADVARISTKQPPEAIEFVQRRFAVSTEQDFKSKQILESGLQEMDVDLDRLIYCDHHMAHAHTAFYPSPFESAYVLVVDGRGDFRSTTMWKASRDEGLELMDLVTETASLGSMYASITRLLGFVHNRHEGKVTGLAAHGKPSGFYDRLRSALYFDPESGKIRSEIGRYYKLFATAKLDELEELAKTTSREDIAYAAQEVLEENTCAYLLHHLDDQSEKVNICLAGGCIGNVKLNMRIRELDPVGNVYVAPAMHDGGIALGGAIHAATTRGGHKKIEMPTVYLGPQYNNDTIRAALIEAGLKFNEFDDKEFVSEVTKLLVDGQIIGWFQGRMEYGPRALGSRSIIASADDPSINDSLNKRLDRTEFMPFAPVTLDRLAAESFINWTPEDAASSYMTMCYDCTDWFKEKCPATVHVDGTARPQVVNRPDAPRYYDVIESYYKACGRPALINTSFNFHEEPILRTPEHAIRSFKNGNVDILAIGNFIITERD